MTPSIMDAEKQHAHDLKNSDLDHQQVEDNMFYTVKEKSMAKKRQKYINEEKASWFKPPKSVDEELSRAAEAGEIKTIQRAMAKGAKVNTKDSFGSTPLIRASMRGELEAMKYLLQQGADPNSKDRYRQTPLIWAAWLGSVPAVKMLLRSGASVNAKASGGWTALTKAAFKGNPDVVPVLMHYGANVHMKTDNDKTALDYASEHGAADRNGGHALVAKILSKKSVKEEPKHMSANSMLAHYEAVIAKGDHYH
jgi:ankyrin repeat protein